MKRSGSGSSNSSENSSMPFRTGSSSNLLSIGFLPASKWRFLRHLSLADNSLTSMTVSSLAPLANTLHSLDLSSNLFAEVPDCLASLTALRALNLSNCMIDSLHSLRRSPLPAIASLNLRSNRLASIAGIERLLSLERLDLRDNKLKDPTELARLTGIPDVREIWVVSNPFAKTHGNYRVTIFNLFRGTPGYSDDIIIDTAGPGYSERKQLRDHAIEVNNVPIVKSPILHPETKDTTLAQGPAFLPTNELGDIPASPRPLPRATQSEIAVGSGRRKRGPRRRIVDLSRDESLSVLHQEDVIQPVTAPVASAFSNPATVREVSLQNGTAAEAIVPQRVDPVSWHPVEPVKGLSMPPPLSPPRFSDKGQSLVDEIQHLNLNGEAYRQKVEALKNEVGSNWLNVLSDEGWNKHGSTERRVPHYLHDPPLRPDLSEMRVQSQGIVSGSRTLG